MDREQDNHTGNIRDILSGLRDNDDYIKEKKAFLGAALKGAVKGLSAFKGVPGAVKRVYLNPLKGGNAFTKTFGGLNLLSDGSTVKRAITGETAKDIGKVELKTI